MGFIGKQPTPAPLTASDITDGIISTDKLADTSVTTAKINADAVSSAKLPDDVISDEHLDSTAITSQTAITSLADTDKFLVSDASDSNNLKYVENQYLGGVGTVKAWARFSGSGTLSIQGSGNVSSVTDNGVGDYIVNYTNNISDTNYAYLTTACNDGGDRGTLSLSATKTVSALRIQAVRFTTSVSVVDMNDCNVAIIR